MKQFKRTICLFLISLLLMLPVSAQNHVSEIDITVTVRDDGSAYIVQNWRGTFTEGSENYIPIRTDGISVHSLQVSDQNGPYNLQKGWNVDASFSQKARKCGILHTEDGVELCFGISEYGENRYAIEYVVEDFIKSYSDKDGTNFMFINPGMNTFPTDAHIEILLQNGTPLTQENAHIWGFGYHGNVEFQNGQIHAYTTQALTDQDSMIVMIDLEKGLLQPVTQVHTPFQSVIDEAFSGSDYSSNEEGEAESILMLSVVALFLVLGIWIGVYLIKRKIALKKFFREAPYYREIPNEGNLLLSHFLAQNFDVASEESLIIGALMVAMIQNGSLEELTEESVGCFGKVKQSTSLKLVKEPTDPAQRQLYGILQSACGADGILQEDELEQAIFLNPLLITDFLKDMRSVGGATLSEKGGFVKRTGNCLKDLSPTGQQELAQVAGLKKYLCEFSLISERELKEVAIWKEYLVYAVLFDIADQVMEQLKNLYPDQVQECNRYHNTIVTAHAYRHSMYRSSQRALQQQRSRGGGGRASLGGGGGFSGGGRGGGSR